MSSADFTFAWEGSSAEGGKRLEVVEFHGTEAISLLYRYELIVLLREPAPEIDPGEFVQSRATLRITTHTEPRFRVVHGIVAEGEELGMTAGGMLYRLVLVPPLARAMHRTRCRIFLEKTTRQIIDAVLQGDPELVRADGTAAPPDDGDDGRFAPAKELFTWRVMDAARIDDVAARPYCVQYNESDFAFVSRLLEEEGIGYHIENGDGVCLFVLSDTDAGRTRLDPFDPLGPERRSREVSLMNLGARLRPRKVSLLDYNWKRPALEMAVDAGDPSEGAQFVEHQYPGRYSETPDHGKLLAMAKLDRLAVEASYAVGESACRVLSAGSIFALEHPRPRYEGEYLVTKFEVRGEQHGVLPPGTGARFAASGIPYQAAFECARRGTREGAAESHFRPARVTPRPRIYGSQTAFVTSEPGAEGAEIHVGGPPGAEIGCVRLKFHWDQEASRHAKEPTSCWVRVNQVFAGMGEGAVFHPRVGAEVIIDFEEGDPDRPIIVGRVYNGRNRPPGGSPAVSTLKTMTSPGDGTFNELMFDDTAGNQQIKLHTPNNWNTEVGHDRMEQVVNNSTSGVGVDRVETTGANRTTVVGVNNCEVIGANESVTIEANQTISVGGSQRMTVTGPQELASVSRQVLEAPAQTLIAATVQTLKATDLSISADATATLQTALMTLLGSGSIKMEAGQLVITSGPVSITGGEITITGGDVKITAGSVGVNGGTVNVVGGLVKLN